MVFFQLNIRDMQCHHFTSGVVMISINILADLDRIVEPFPIFTIANRIIEFFMLAQRCSNNSNISMVGIHVTNVVIDTITSLLRKKTSE